MQFPLELLAIIAKYLNKTDLKRLRLVCRRLAEITAPFLFTSIFLSPDPYDLEHAGLTLGRFKNLVKTIILSPLRYPKMSLMQYEVRVNEVRDRIGLWIPVWQLSRHMAKGYKIYCRIEQRISQGSALTNFEDMMERVLREAPNARQVIITHRNRFQHMQDEELKQYCHWSRSRCSLAPETHEVFRLTPLQSLGDSRSPRIAQSFFAIIPAGTRKIKEVMMQTPGPNGGVFRMPIENFAPPARYTFQVSTFMANLVKLRLDIDDVSKEKESLRQGTMAKFLSQARNLENLFLATTESCDKGMFRFTLGCCRFPRLRILVLKNTGIDGVDLEPFLKGAPRLKRLVLEGCITTGFLAEQLLEQIRAATALEALHMNCVFRDLGDVWDQEASLHYWDYHGEVEKYLLHDGPNPFSVQQLERYVSDCRRKRIKNRPEPRKAEEYYDRYF